MINWDYFIASRGIKTNLSIFAYRKINSRSPVQSIFWLDMMQLKFNFKLSDASEKFFNYLGLKL